MLTPTGLNPSSTSLPPQGGVLLAANTVTQPSGTSPVYPPAPPKIFVALLPPATNLDVSVAAVTP